MFNNQVIAGSSGQGGGFYDFPIEQSLRFNDNDSAYLSRTPASAGNRKTWTWSGWVKRGNLSGVRQGIFTCVNSAGDDYVGLEFLANDKLSFASNDSTPPEKFRLETNAVFRDTSAWYHICVFFNTSQANASDRAAIYVNGVLQTYSTSTYMSQNYDGRINTTVQHNISSWLPAAGLYLDGYLADVTFVDGTAYTADSFGELKSGIWIPKDTSGLTFGTNGFRLQYGDSAAIGDDTSGNTNDWTVNNLVASDVVPDSVSNNFAVVPSTTLKSTGYSQHTEGNLQLYQPSWGGWDINLANFNLPSSGKYYWEVMPVQGIFNAGYGAFIFGIGNIRGRENISGFPTFGNPLIQVDSRGIGEYRQYPAWVDYTKSGSFGFTVGSTVYGIAVDCDAKKFWFSLDNSWAGTSGTTLTAGTGDPANGTNGDLISGDITDYVPFFNLGDQQSSCKLGINFGQDSTFAGATTAGGNTDENGYGDFKYAPPSGFLSLCSANLPSGAIDTLADETPEDYFSTLTYSGTGATNSLTGVGFQPSFTWIKQRTQAYHHELYDAVRGVQKMLQSSSTQQETTETQGLLSFDSDGFTVGTRTNVNQNSTNLVSWNWKANGSGVSNTDGSITSTVSVGATSQQNWFSVVGYTGDGTVASGSNVGHGLGRKPDAIIVKDRSAAYNWNAWFNSFTGSQVIYPNLTNARNSDANVWSATEPTSSVFYVGNGEVNASSNNYIAYCFANAEGLCKVGSYVGNGSADGPFVYTGFRPAFVMVKRTDSTASWQILDSKRNTFNDADNLLFPNLSNAESTTTSNNEDFSSNGFKARGNGNQSNASGGSYIYLAIAEQPFKYANAR